MLPPAPTAAGIPPPATGLAAALTPAAAAAATWLELATAAAAAAADWFCMAAALAAAAAAMVKEEYWCDCCSSLTWRNKEKLYPYIFIDRTNKARVNNLQIFTDIFAKHLEVIIGRMKYYLITEADFVSSYKIIGDNIADANKRPQLHCDSQATSESSSDSESSQSTDSRRSSASESDSDRIKSRTKSRKSKSGKVFKYKQRRQREQEIARVIRRHYKNSKLLSKDS